MASDTDAVKVPLGMVELPVQKKKKKETTKEISKSEHDRDGEGASLASPSSSAEALREAGNELFRRGDYGGAAAMYASCISVDDSDVAALANRAECYLRARQFHLALADATASLAADPAYNKSLYKRAMALNGLGRYADAIKALKELLAVETSDEAAINALAECQMLQDQAFLGKYDMPALLFGRLASSFRRCADHVGPVKVSAGTAHSRGVVTTRAVTAGQLLMVSSPLVVAPLVTGVEKALVQGLVGAASRNPQDLSLILALPAGNGAASTLPVPDMAAFRRHLSKGEEAFPELPQQAIFTRHAANVVKTSAMRNAASVGVYALPSFINHSCAPNACKLLIGHTMFIHAAKDMVKGEEVLIKYFDVTMPRHDRAAIAKRWGFSCECRRCALESIGEEAAMEAMEMASKAAAAARAVAVKDADSKKPGGDKDGSRAAAEAAAGVMESQEIGSVAMLVAAMRARAKLIHDDVSKTLEQWKRTKGKSGAPDPNLLVELATWFESKCDALGLDATRAAWARTSVLQVYYNINHCFSAAGQLEARAEHLEKIADTLARTDPASFEHCTQLAVGGNNARRAFRGKGGEKAIARVEAACAAVHTVRYGCRGVGGGGASSGGGQLYLTAADEVADADAAGVAAELVKRTRMSNEEGRGEFCEA